MKIGEVIYKYEAQIYNETKIECSTKKYKVLGKNDSFFCIDDLHFTEFYLAPKKADKHYGRLEKVGILDWTDMKFYGKKFTVYIYTRQDKKYAEKEMNKDFNAFLNKKCSNYLFSEKIKIKLS